MNLKLVISFTILVIIICFTCCNSQDLKPPIFNIDMTSGMASERWAEVSRHYAKYTPHVRALANDWVPRWLQPYVWMFGKMLSTMWNPESAEELKAFTQNGVSFGELAMVNMIYDITAFDRHHILGACTSIITCDANNQIFHARNLDYDMGELIRNMTFIANFQYSGKTKYQGVMFAYFIGVLTGQRINEYTVSLNERFSGGIMDNIFMALLTRVRHPVGLAIRETLTTKHTYDEAVNHMSKVKLIAPSYVIIAGRKDGVVITRARDIWNLTCSSNTSHNWYRVETNHDHWLPAPEGDERRAVANEEMTSLGKQNVNDRTLFKVMSEDPVLNSGTLFTTIMSPWDAGLLNETTRIRIPKATNHQ